MVVFAPPRHLELSFPGPGGTAIRFGATRGCPEYKFEPDRLQFGNPFFRHIRCLPVTEKFVLSSLALYGGRKEEKEQARERLIRTWNMLAMADIEQYAPSPTWQAEDSQGMC